MISFIGQYSCSSAEGSGFSKGSDSKFSISCAKRYYYWQRRKRGASHWGRKALTTARHSRWTGREARASRSTVDRGSHRGDPGRELSGWQASHHPCRPKSNLRASVRRDGGPSQKRKHSCVTTRARARAGTTFDTHPLRLSDRDPSDGDETVSSHRPRAPCRPRSTPQPARRSSHRPPSRHYETGDPRTPPPPANEIVCGAGTALRPEGRVERVSGCQLERPRATPMTCHDVTGRCLDGRAAQAPSDGGRAGEMKCLPYDRLPRSSPLARQWPP